MRKFAPLFFAVLLLFYITGIAQAMPISEDGTGLVPDNIWTDYEEYTFMGGVTLEAGTYYLVFELNGTALCEFGGNPCDWEDTIGVEARVNGRLVAATSRSDIDGTAPVPFTVVLPMTFESSNTINLTIISKELVSDPENEKWQVDSAILSLRRTADFIASPTSGRAPLTVNFSDLSAGTTS